LTPFAAINPCGYPGLAVTQCRDLGLEWRMNDAEQALTYALTNAIYT
jgi:lipoyl(octanoyl) transferase